MLAAPELDAGAAAEGATALRLAGAAPRRAAVLYLLSFVPTYVAWELRELTRRGVPLAIVLSAPWPRAAMWEHITGFDRHAADLLTADFFRWLTLPARTLVGPAGRALARLMRRRGAAGLPLAARCLRAGTFRHYLAAAWLSDALADRPLARVHCHFATDTALVGMLLARLRGVPFSLTTHARDIFVPRQPRRAAHLLAGAAPVLTISHFNRAHLERLAGAEVARRAHVLHLGVDVDALPRWSPARDVFTIACTASGLGEKKGVAVLLDACALLETRGVRFRCLICGADPGGQRLAELRRLVRERGLGEAVRLLGVRTSAETQQLVSHASLFVLPAIRTPHGDMDGIPVSLMEAMGMGVPVVATRLSGIPELVEDGRSGLLVAPGDAHELADAIERVARDAALARVLAVGARRRVRDAFSLARAVDGLLAAWSEPVRAGATGGES